MKKLFYILLISILVGACSDDLNLVPESEISSANFFVSESDFRLYSNQFYDYFPREGRGFQDFIWRVDNNSDNQCERNNGNIFAFGVNTINDNPPTYGGGGWNFSDIRAVNFYLDNLKESPLAENAKARWEAEGRFFRAYLYFDKLRKYGDVPWFDTALSDNDEEIYKPRDPRTFVITKIMEDLDFAIAHLPQSEGNKDYIDRFVALAFKARAALYEGTFRKYHGTGDSPDELLSQAAQSCETIMNEGNYQLHTQGGPNNCYYNYFQLIDKASSNETILARTFSNELGVTHWSQRFMSTVQFTGFSKSLVDDYLCKDGLPVSLSPLFNPETDYDYLLDEMANRDPRMKQSIINPGDLRFTGPDLKYPNDLPIFNVNHPTGYNINKFRSTNRDLQVPGTGYDGIALFRLGEVYLIYAEAKAELGTITQTDLDNSINKLRSRVGMAPMVMNDLQRDPDSDFNGSIPEIPAVPVIIDEIRRERRIELAAEGMRRDDIVRWKAGQLLAQTPLGRKFNPEVYPSSVGRPWARTNEDGFLEPYQGSTRVRQFDENKNYLYPIPPDQIGLYPEGVLKQNPGWE